MKRIFKKNFLMTMISSYLCIAAAMLVALGVILGVYQKYYERDSKNFNDYLFHNIAAAANTVVRDMNQMKISLQKNDIINDFLRSDKTDVFKKEITYEAVRELKSFSSMSMNIDLSFIYLQEIDSVIYEGGVISSYAFYEMWFSGDSLSYEEWKAELLSETTERYLLFDGQNGAEKPIEYLSLIFRASYDNSAVGVIMCNKQNMMSGLEKIKWQKDCRIFIFNPHGRLVVSNLDDGEELPASVSDILKSRDNSVEIFQSECVIANNKWQTVVTIQKDELVYGLRMIRWVIIIVLICSVIVLALMITYFVRHNYRPAQRVFALLKMTGNDQQMDVAYNRISAILSKNKYMSEEIQKREKTLIDSYLTSRLKGGYFNQKINFRFAGTGFAVLIFQIRDMACFFSDVTLSENEKRYHLNFVIENVISEKLSMASIHSYFLTVDNRYVGIANAEGPLDMAALNQAVSEGIEFINENFEIQLCYALSQPQESSGELVHAYQQAENVMDYICFYECYESMSFRQFTDLIHAETGISFKENIFSGMVQNGQTDKACSVVEGVFSHIAENRDISIDQVYFVAMQIISIVEKINSHCLLEETVTSGNSILYQNLKQQHTLKAVGNYVKQYTYQVCEEMHAMLAEKRSAVNIRAVLTHIRESYSDQNFNLNAAALHFGITPAYLSKQFKKKTGIAMIDYINILRVERVNELLRGKQYSLEQALEMSGFTNERTYFRVKKKVSEMNVAEYHRRTEI